VLKHILHSQKDDFFRNLLFTSFEPVLVDRYSEVPSNKVLNRVFEPYLLLHDITEWSNENITTGRPYKNLTPHALLSQPKIDTIALRSDAYVSNVSSELFYS